MHYICYNFPSEFILLWFWWLVIRGRHPVDSVRVEELGEPLHRPLSVVLRLSPVRPIYHGLDEIIINCKVGIFIYFSRTVSSKIKIHL